MIAQPWLWMHCTQWFHLSKRYLCILYTRNIYILIRVGDESSLGRSYVWYGKTALLTTGPYCSFLFQFPSNGVNALAECWAVQLTEEYLLSHCIIAKWCRYNICFFNRKRTSIYECINAFSTQSHQTCDDQLKMVSAHAIHRKCKIAMLSVFFLRNYHIYIWIILVGNSQHL